MSLFRRPAPADPLSELRNQVDSWVASLLKEQEPTHVRAPKLIRDAVHGYHLLARHEVSVLDSRIVQRLRYIHQTAFAYLVYPTGHHTRFDHSLGVATVAERVLRGLQGIRHIPEVDETVIQEVRLAGLLHDVGHAFFSHLSESILKETYHDWWTVIKKQEYQGRERFFEKAEPGEILSYLIVTSKRGREFLDAALTMNGAVEVNLDRVAGLIIGQPPHSSRQYLADIINGPMDADKIDYLLRDCHFSGIKAEVDPERIYYTVDVLRSPGWPSYLTIRAGGVPHLEQMLFARMMLFTSIYHHHKIRTLECMIRSLFEVPHDQIKDKRMRLDSISDFLRLEERDFFVLGLEERALAPQIRMILDRRLLKRTLVISRNTVKEHTLKAIPEFEKLRLQGAEETRRLREEIHDSLPASAQEGVDKLWVDIPKGPDIDYDANHCWILPGNVPMALSDSFPTADWLRAYESNKLRAHVFYVDDVNKRRIAAGVSQQVLRRRFGLEFKELATVLCNFG